MKKNEKPASTGTSKKKTVPVRAWLNWNALLKNDLTFRGDKGLPIFGNPDHKSAGEDWLVEMAEANGGSVELTMKVKVTVNKGVVVAPTLADLA